MSPIAKTRSKQFMNLIPTAPEAFRIEEDGKDPLHQHQVAEADRGQDPDHHQVEEERDPQAS